MTLRVKLEIVPYGDENKLYEIGRLDIFNKRISRFGYSEYGILELSPVEIGMYVQTVEHDRRLGAWKLVEQVLRELHIEGPGFKG